MMFIKSRPPLGLPILDVRLLKLLTVNAANTSFTQKYTLKYIVFH